MSEAALAEAIATGDPGAVIAVLDRSPAMRSNLDAPLIGDGFGITPMVRAATKGNLALVDVLLEAGADINGRTHWWAGSFGVLDTAPVEIAPQLIERGATLDAHSAARLNRVTELTAMLDANPELVNARGGDGQTPLHFAASVEVAALLIDRGAKIDARDIDHESTPAQYMLRDRKEVARCLVSKGCQIDRGAKIDARDIDHESTPAQYMLRDRKEVARCLVSKGCQTDILMAAALGDVELVRKYLESDPKSIYVAVTEHYFPKENPESGGTIYYWTIGQFKTAHNVAGDNQPIKDLLNAYTPPDLQLVAAALENDTELVANLLAGDDAPQFEDEKLTATALHWAAWHGNTRMVDALLKRSSPLEVKDMQYQGTPLGWAEHASRMNDPTPGADLPRVIAMLETAGAKRGSH
jgi:ankyrin repeat protein